MNGLYSSPLHPRILCLLEIGPVVLEKTFSEMSSMYFRYFVIISYWKRAFMSLCLDKFETPSPKNAFCHVWLNSGQWFSGRIFLLFHYLPLEKGVALHMKTLEFPSPNVSSWQVWLNWPCNLQKISNFVNIFPLLRYENLQTDDQTDRRMTGVSEKPTWDLNSGVQKTLNKNLAPLLEHLLRCFVQMKHYNKYWLWTTFRGWILIIVLFRCFWVRIFT